MLIYNKYAHVIKLYFYQILNSVYEIPEDGTGMPKHDGLVK
jgi:hypothetical protein